MALALADSIASVGWDLNDQADRYLAWWQNGDYSVNGRCFDIGITTRSALSRFEKTGDAKTSGDPLGARGRKRLDHAAGPGADPLRRPVSRSSGRADPPAGRIQSADARQPAVPVGLCLLGARAGGLIHGELTDGRSWTRTGSRWRNSRKSFPLHPEIDEVAAGSFRRKQPPEIVGSGYVVKSLEAALWAFHDAKDFREAVLRAVNLGDDADTTGAVCGQLAGAYWGEDGIPDEVARRVGPQGHDREGVGRTPSFESTTAEGNLIRETHSTSD